MVSKIPTHHNLKFHNILIVEDEVIIALNIKQDLEALGYHVVEICSTGKCAIETCKKLDIDLIIMDIRIKGSMNGIETANEISKFMEIPLIFLTAFSDDEYVEEARKLMPVAYIKKPFQKQDLKLAINIGIFKYIMNRDLKTNEEKYRLMSEQLEKLVTLRTNQLKEANSNLSRVNSDLEEFISFLYHEIQEPVRRINTHFDLIQSENTEDQEKHKPLVKKNISELNLIIQNLKDYADLLNSKPMYQAFSLRKLIDEILENLEDVPDTSIITEFDDPMISGDKNQIYILLYLIIKNRLSGLSDQAQTSLKIMMNKSDSFVTLKIINDDPKRNPGDSKIHTAIYERVAINHNGDFKTSNSNGSEELEFNFRVASN